LREKFGYKVSDPVWAFLKRIKIVDENDKYTEHFGDPIWVYYQYLMAKGDKRSKEEIYAEGEATLKRIAERGVPISRGHGKHLWDLEPELDKKIRDNYDNAKIALWSEFSQEFIDTIPNAVIVSTTSKDREEYVAHPPTGEKLSPAAVATLEKLRDAWSGKPRDIQIVISDGLNTNAIMDEGHLAPYLEEVRKELTGAGFTVSEKHVVMKSGRVRAGYAIGSVLFAKADVAKPKVILHVIGERPGSGHNNYSVYIAAPRAEIWVKKGVDHDIARVISGISDTAYNPADAARETVTIVKEMTGP
jgi:ethanolamine ammonia-lyase large subunit